MDARGVALLARRHDLRSDTARRSGDRRTLRLIVTRHGQRTGECRSLRHARFPAPVGSSIARQVDSGSLQDFLRNLLTRVPKSAGPFVATLVRSIFATARCRRGAHAVESGARAARRPVPGRGRDARGRRSRHLGVHRGRRDLPRPRRRDPVRRRISLFNRSCGLMPLCQATSSRAGSGVRLSRMIG